MTLDARARISETAIPVWPVRRFALPRCLTSEHPLPWLLPMTAMLIAFGIYPLLYAIWLSLHRRNPLMRSEIFSPAWNWDKLVGDGRAERPAWNQRATCAVILSSRLPRVLI